MAGLDAVPNMAPPAPQGQPAQQPQQQNFQDHGQPPAAPGAPYNAQQQQQGAMPNGMAQVPPDPTGTPVTDPNLDPQAGAFGQGASPLDSFVPKADNNNADGKNSSEAPPKSIFDTSLGDYQKLVKGKDFVGQISPEAMQQVLQGDPQALSTVINQAVQAGVASAAYMSGKVTNSGLNSHFETFQNGTLPKLLQDNAVSTQFANNKHEILNHPAVAPLVETYTSQVRSQFPTASPAEIQQKVIEYFSAMSQAMHGFNQSNQDAAAAAEAQGNEEQQGGLSRLFSDM